MVTRAMQTIAERIRRDRERWEHMSMPLGGIRGPVLSEESRASLGKLLWFHHFFRHAYAVEFDGALLLDHASRVATAHPRLAQELRLFVAQLLD